MGGLARAGKTVQPDTETVVLAAQYEAWLAERQQRLAERAARPPRRPDVIAGDLVERVACRDAEGVRRLLNKYADQDSSLLLSLAATANPVLAAMVARAAPKPVVRRAARSACDLIPAVQDERLEFAADVIRRQAGTWEHYAALAVVLAESATKTASAVAARDAA